MFESKRAIVEATDKLTVYPVASSRMAAYLITVTPEDHFADPRILSAASRVIPECDLDQPPKFKVISALLDAAAQLREAGLAARPFTVVTSRDVTQRCILISDTVLFKYEWSKVA